MQVLTSPPPQSDFKSAMMGSRWSFVFDSMEDRLPSVEDMPLEDLSMEENRPRKRQEAEFHIPSWVPKGLVDSYRGRMALLVPQTVMCTMKKAIVEPHQLNGRELEVYHRIIALGDQLQEHLIWMDKALSQRISGRMVDSLMTKYPTYCDVYYYIDETTIPSRYVSYKEGNSSMRLFNIATSYRSYMNRYTKQLFDPFGRGTEVLHRQKDGQYITFSLCKVMFYLWARKNHVLDFLLENYENITRVQRSRKRRKKSQPVVMSAFCSSFGTLPQLSTPLKLRRVVIRPDIVKQ